MSWGHIGEPIFRAGSALDKVWAKPKDLQRCMAVPQDERGTVLHFQYKRSRHRDTVGEITPRDTVGSLCLNRILAVPMEAFFVETRGIMLNLLVTAPEREHVTL